MNAPDDDDDVEDEDGGFVKKSFNSYSVRPGKVYLPIAEAVSGLPAGIYQTIHTYEGLMFKSHEVNTDELVDIPGSMVDVIFNDMKDFWEKKQKYELLKLSHKRGYLLHGPPGTGKTSILVMLGRKVVESNGVVIIPKSDEHLVDAVDALRTTEKGRPLMFIIEEISEFLDKKASEVLSLLDGEGSPDNILFTATTNDLNLLANNIRKRPGRFDRVMEIGYPDAKIRYAYAKNIIQRDIYEIPSVGENLALEIARQTDTLSLAHVREMVVSHLILGHPLAEIKDRFSK